MIDWQAILYSVQKFVGNSQDYGIFSEEDAQKLEECAQRVRRMCSSAPADIQNAPKNPQPRTVAVEISLEDERNLRRFAGLPSWISDEFSVRYGECNAPPLPVAEVQRLVGQFKKCRGV